MDALLCRSIRRRIVEICNCVYRQEYNLIDEYWYVLEQELLKVLREDEAIYAMVNELQRCMKQCNFLRVRDILTYEVDVFLFQQLNSLSQSERKRLAKEAKEQNEQALQTYHQDIWELLCVGDDCERIECDYAGAENASISVIEGNMKYRLFSEINPWLECNGYINVMEIAGRISEEMYMLGFGGGYVVDELQRRYPEMRIKVLIPNLDVFGAVMSSVPLSHILRHKNLELKYEPIWLDFFTILASNMKMGNRNAFFIDKQELRACTRSAGIADQLVKFYNNQYGKTSIADNVGEKIYKFIADNYSYF